ncbi:MAG: transposase [Tildeniella nuda ZEHNDER 1965/U140]|nr:transposase [Tildeniella nuda ZEHNDER 1965/U140]
MQTVFYISLRSDSAAAFAQQIRGQWQIENRLHWVKEMVLHEDKTPWCDGHALTNMAILRTMTINLFRQQVFNSITKAMRHVAHALDRLFSFLQ